MRPNAYGSKDKLFHIKKNIQPEKKEKQRTIKFEFLRVPQLVRELFFALSFFTPPLAPPLSGEEPCSEGQNDSAHGKELKLSHQAE